jgi:TPR repeat protein
MYMSGQGVETNHKRALELLQRACARGVIHAHYHLGQADLRGLGTARDAKCALEHFNAGWAGCPDCRCAFGTMYALGDGVPVDREKALTSLYVGGKTGHIMSLITLEALFPDEPKRPKLDPQHLRDAAPIIAELRERANEK